MAFIVIQNTKTRKLSGTGIDCVWLIKKKTNPTYMEKSYWIYSEFPFTEKCRIDFFNILTNTKYSIFKRSL